MLMVTPLPSLWRSAGWSVVPKPCRRERKFWMQRPGVKKPPERALLSAETVNLKIGSKIPAETASFQSTAVSAVREDWVVVCAVIREPVSAPSGLITGVLQGTLPISALFCQSTPDFGPDDQRLSGRIP